MVDAVNLFLGQCCGDCAAAHFPSTERDWGTCINPEANKYYQPVDFYDGNDCAAFRKKVEG